MKKRPYPMTVRVKEMILNEKRSKYCRGCLSHETQCCLVVGDRFKRCPCKKCLVKSMCKPFDKCDEYKKDMPYLRIR